MGSIVDSIDRQREGSEIYHGAELCKQKSMEFLEQCHLPAGLLQVDFDEVGINRGTGFFWVKPKKSKDHRFSKIGRLVSYSPVITAFVEDRRMRKITGVKTRELLIWVSVSDMCINDPASRKITFRTPTGISQTFPLSAFVPDEAKAEQN